MNSYTLKVDSISKYFGRRLIFKEISLDYKENGIYGIAGPNGSGKSTLVKILAGIISPSGGQLIHSCNGKKINPEELHNYIGFVSPYLVLYDEFSAEENIKVIEKIRGKNFEKERFDFLFNAVGLYDRRKDLLKTYSSGMKQRMKFIFALIHSPDLLILDEPTSNLDEEGKEKIYTIMQKEAESNIVLVASNEEQDLKWCSSVLNISKYRDIK